jgi:hypothetical protein
LFPAGSLRRRRGPTISSRYESESGVWPVRIPLLSSRSFLLIVRTCRIVTACAVAQDPRSFQQIARLISAWVAEFSTNRHFISNVRGRTTARSRTVSRRSEPSSRTALMGEQPNPWEVLPPQDATSRHRGAKPRRRCERLGVISLLSPG